MAIDPPKPIKLYSNKSCPWAQRSRIALLEAGVKYEEVEIDLQNKPEWYTAKINNQGKVPVLDFGGEILIESAVISEVPSLGSREKCVNRVVCGGLVP